DGAQVLSQIPVQTLNPGEYCYLKQGLYRDASVSDVAVIYHDGFVIGTTAADLEPAPVTPPPQPDAGTPPPVADAGTPAPTPAPAANSPTLRVSPRRCGSIPARCRASRAPGMFFTAFQSVLRRWEKAALTSMRKRCSSRTSARGAGSISSTSAQLSTSGGGVKACRGTDRPSDAAATCCTSTESSP